MLHACRLKTIEPFYKTCNHKQSLQSFENRSNISQVIKMKPNIVLPKTRLLLVDDVVTSGNTLLCAYDLLQKHRYKIEALALCANPRFVESCEKKDLKRKGMFSIL
ncbi:MAG: phosphoribosyltransferase family protein [[Clostridium] innocuum]